MRSFLQENPGFVKEEIELHRGENGKEKKDENHVVSNGSSSFLRSCE